MGTNWNARVEKCVKAVDMFPGLNDPPSFFRMTDATKFATQNNILTSQYQKLITQYPGKQKEYEDAYKKLLDYDDIDCKEWHIIDSERTYRVGTTLDIHSMEQQLQMSPSVTDTWSYDQLSARWKELDNKLKELALPQQQAERRAEIEQLENNLQIPHFAFANNKYEAYKITLKNLISFRKTINDFETITGYVFFV